MGKNKNKQCVKGGPRSHNKGQQGDRDSLPDVSQQLDEVIGGDFAAVLPVQWRKLAIHVQASLSIFEHLPGNTFPPSQWLSQLKYVRHRLGIMGSCVASYLAAQAKGILK